MAEITSCDDRGSRLVADRRRMPRRCASASVMMHGGYGLLFHESLSLGVVNHVIGARRRPLRIHLYASYVNVERPRDQPGFEHPSRMCGQLAGRREAGRPLHGSTLLPKTCRLIAGP